MAELDVGDVFQALGVVHVERVPLAAALEFFAVGMNQRDRLAVRQPGFHLSLFRLVVNLSQV